MMVLLRIGSLYWACLNTEYGGVAEFLYGHVKTWAHNQKAHNKVTKRNAGNRLQSAETLDTPFPLAWYVFSFFYLDDIRPGYV